MLLEAQNGEAHPLKFAFDCVTFVSLGPGKVALCL